MPLQQTAKGNRESGANPERSRHCNRKVFFSLMSLEKSGKTKKARRSVSQETYPGLIPYDAFAERKGGRRQSSLCCFFVLFSHTQALFLAIRTGLSFCADKKERRWNIEASVCRMDKKEKRIILCFLSCFPREQAGLFVFTHGTCCLPFIFYYMVYYSRAG